jgi:hypothetical protein
VNPAPAGAVRRRTRSLWVTSSDPSAGSKAR